MTWIKRSAEGTFKRLTASGNELDWMPLTNDGNVKLFYHLSTTDSDRTNLFNLYRDAVLRFVSEWEIDIDDEMIPFFLALEPDRFEDFDTPDLQQKYSLTHEYFFDRAFFIQALDMAGRPLGLRPEVFARRMLNAVDGMWLMFRFSSGGAGQPIESIEQTRMNVSLIRIRPFAHLSPLEVRTPLFIYESRSDFPDQPLMRVHGHLYPAGGRINFLGQRDRHQEPTPAPIAFSWPLSDEGLSGRSSHMTKNYGVAYGMNSSLQRIAFYFFACFIPASNAESKAAYDERVKVYKRLVGVYPTATLDTELRTALGRAQQHYLSELPDKRENPLAGSELPLAIPTRDDLNELFKDSREHIVFKRR